MKKCLLKSIYFLLMFLCICLTFCSDSVTPKEEPGRRDYVWKVDTVGNDGGYLSLMRFKGFNENDVWACGSGSTDNEIWHFNGTKWENKSFGRGYGLGSIYGAVTNDMWLFNLEAEIYRLINEQWVKVQELEIENSIAITIQGSYGLGQTDLYAFGDTDYSGINNYKGVLYHYDGSGWKLKELVDEKVSFVDIFWDKRNNEYKIMGIHWDAYGNSDKRLYSYDKKVVKKIYEGEKDGNIDLEYMGVVGEEIWYGYKKTISKFENRNFKPVVNLMNNVFSGGSLRGRNSNDVFFTSNKTVYHYNGTDVKEILEIEGSVHIYGIEVFEKSIFVFYKIIETGKSAVHRGYIK